MQPGDNYRAAASCLQDAVDTDVFDIKTWAPGADPAGDPTERAGGVLQGGNIVVHAR